MEAGGPVRVGTSIADMGSGLWGATGILAALNRRPVTGEGCHIGPASDIRLAVNSKRVENRSALTPMRSGPDTAGRKAAA